MKNTNNVQYFDSTLIVGCLAFIILVIPCLLQAAPLPSILSFTANPTLAEVGQDVTFSWEVKNADTIRFYENNRELEGSIQLLNGSFGWPLKMPGAFRTTLTETSVYKLVGETREGKTVIKTLMVQVKDSQLRGKYSLQQKSNGRFLDAHEGSNDNSVVTRDRQTSTSQVWIFTPVGTNRYRIQQMSSRRYMDAHEDSNDNSVVTRDTQKNNTQQWIIKPF
jgi:hypothetical protein